jgi:hypothetical protein
MRVFLDLLYIELTVDGEIIDIDNLNKKKEKEKKFRFLQNKFFVFHLKIQNTNLYIKKKKNSWKFNEF